MYILLLLGIALILWVAFKSGACLKAKNWNKTNGVLTEVSEGLFEELNLYSPPTAFKFPKAKYKYSVEKTTYLNDKITFEKRNYFKHEPSDNEFWNNWQPGDKIDVYYNPSDPAESVLIPYLSTKRRSHYLAIIISGLLLIVSGFIVNNA